MAGKDTSRHPVETVSWNEAVEFCSKLSALPPERNARRVYRLPTEAEWDYACRAGTTTRVYWGDDLTGLPEMGWFIGNTGGKTHPVGEKKPNPWGLHDMLGNVMHWCSDWFGRDYYRQSPSNDPTGPTASDGRKVQRGCYLFAKPHSFRSSMRTWHEPSNRSYACGFRIVCEIDSKARPAPDAGWENAINLLPLIDPKRDVVEGGWTIQNGELISDAVNYGRIEIPYQPPDEYDFRIRFSVSLPKETGPVQLLSKADRQFRWQCFCRPNSSVAFESVRGRDIREGPARAELSVKMQPGQRYVSLVEVRNGVVRGYLDGKLCVEWKTDYADMDISPKWRLRTAGLLGLGSQVPTAFHRIEVREVTGKGKFIRGTPKVLAIDDAFIKEVAALPAEQQVARVVAKLKELNPGYDGTETHRISNGQVVELSIRNTTITNLAPVASLKNLASLSCGGRSSPQSGTQRSPLNDLSPLWDLPLSTLLCGVSNVADLSPLREMPLTYLHCGNTKVSDLSPLRGMPLTTLLVNHTQVRDLSPLRGMPLTRFACFHTKVDDWSPIQGMPLKDLRCDCDPNRDAAILLLIKTLEKINGLPPATFWQEIKAGRMPPPDAGIYSASGDDNFGLAMVHGVKGDSRSTAPAFIKEVAALPAEEQVKRVVAKLKELNPGYDGEEEHGIVNGEVVVLKIRNTTIKDISPVRALGNLKLLACGGYSLPQGGYASSPLADLTSLQGLLLTDLLCDKSEVHDLSPLRGMRLQSLGCANTLVSDLTPLQNMPLKILNIGKTRVSDLSPIRGKALTELWCEGTKVQDMSSLKEVSVKQLRCDFVPERDTEILRSIKTLEKINGLPVADFWKQVEAGKTPPPYENLRKAASADESSIERPVTTDDAFIKEVAAQPPEQQVARVVAKLKELNPGYDGKEEHKIENGEVVVLIIQSSVADISPIRALGKLERLFCNGGGRVGGHMPLADLRPLQGLLLRRLECSSSAVVDLSPLRGMPIESLGIAYTNVKDISPLHGMPLKTLNCVGSKVANLAPLQGMPLEQLLIHGTPVSDLSPLQGMSLTELWCYGTNVTDLTPIKDVPLKRLRCDFDPKRDTKILRTIKTLEKINELPVTEFWKQVDSGKIPPPTANMGKAADEDESSAPTATDDTFIKEVATLPAEQQVARVVAKLKELNPGYDGQETHKIEKRKVIELTVFNTTIKDLSPVRALVNLQLLRCGGVKKGTTSPLADLTPLQGLPLRTFTCTFSEVSDLSPLRGMSLTSLTCGSTRVADLSPLRRIPLIMFNCSGTRVADLNPLEGMRLETLIVSGTLANDLSPLRGMPLTFLACNKTRVTDLSPLKDMPLKELGCDFDSKRDTEILRSIKTLETINRLPVAEFWKQVAAGKIPSPETGLGKKQE